MQDIRRQSNGRVFPTPVVESVSDIVFGCIQLGIDLIERTDERDFTDAEREEFANLVCMVVQEMVRCDNENKQQDAS